MGRSGWWKNERGEFYVIVQFVLFGVVLFGPRAWPSWSPWPSPWDVVALVAGIALLLCGGFLALGGILALGRNLAVVPFPKLDGALVQRGVYRLVRHPIYAGLILGAVGWGLVRQGWLTLVYAALLLLFFDLKSRREELWLRQAYPDYMRYQKRVKKLIPFIY